MLHIPKLYCIAEGRAQVQAEYPLHAWAYQRHSGYNALASCRRNTVQEGDISCASQALF